MTTFTSSPVLSWNASVARANGRPRELCIVLSNRAPTACAA